MKIQNSKKRRHWDLGNSAKDSILVYLALHESRRHLEGLGFGCSLSSRMLQDLRRLDLTATRSQSSEASLPLLGLAQDPQSC